MASGEAMATSAEAPLRAATPRIALRPHASLPWLLLPEGMPLQVLIDTAPVRVPNTQSWFHGVVSQRGNLLPVFDVGHWAGLDPVDRAQAQIVAVGIGAHACAVLCAATPMLLMTEGDAPAGGFDAGALAPYVGDGYASAVGTAHVFDIQRWLTTAAQQVSGRGAVTATH